MNYSKIPILRKLIKKQPPWKKLVRLSNAYTSDQSDERVDITADVSKLMVEGDVKHKADATRTIPKRRPWQKPPPKEKLADYVVVPIDHTPADHKKALVKETVIFEQIIRDTWARMGNYQNVQSSETGHRKMRKGRHHVEFERIYATHDRIWFKLKTRQAGLMNYTSGLPTYVRVGDLIHPDALLELSFACHRQVASVPNFDQLRGHNWDFSKGVWVVVYRLGSTAGLPDGVIYSSLMEHYPTKAGGLTLLLGISEGRKVEYVNLEEYFHILIAGAAGMGKSNMLKALICQILTYSSDTELIWVDLKRLDAEYFRGLPMVKIVGYIEDAVQAVKDLIAEAYRRIELMAGKAVKFSEWNEGFPDQKLPRIVLAIDEFAELVYQNDKIGNEIKTLIARLTNISRAVGITVIACTQHPVAEVIPNKVKINFPLWIGFKVQNLDQSRVMFGDGRAADLPMVPGRGYAQFNAVQIMLQTPRVTSTDIDKAKKARKDNFGKEVRPIEAAQPPPVSVEAPITTVPEASQDTVEVGSRLMVLPVGRAIHMPLKPVAPATVATVKTPIPTEIERIVAPVSHATDDRIVQINARFGLPPKVFIVRCENDAESARETLREFPKELQGLSLRLLDEWSVLHGKRIDKDTWNRARKVIAKEKQLEQH